jgi:hypothetical protein
MRPPPSRGSEVWSYTGGDDPIKEGLVAADIRRHGDTCRKCRGPPADALIEESRNRATSRLGGRDRLASLLLGSLFAATATALALLAPTDRASSAWTITLLVGSYAVASRIDFEIGTGYAVPTQLVLIPMLALVPVRIVPLCVLAGLLLGGLPDYARGRVPIDRSVLRFVNSWYAVGPALVLIAAGEPQPTPSHLPVYAAALVAQFAFDFGSTAARDRLGLGVAPASLLPIMCWIWAVDSALTPVAILAALGSCHERWDGAGYPDGLAGEQIPLVARIVCACDAFSAMTTTRSYRAAMSREEAIAELERCAGSHFDPQVVAALVAAVGAPRRAQPAAAA